jgi:hypothetical protein
MVSEAPSTTRPLSLDLELTSESISLGLRLVGAMTMLRGCIDELEGDLLEVSPRGVDHEGLSEGKNTLLGSGDATLKDEEVVLDKTVVGEATHGVDVLLADVGIGRGVVLVLTGSDSVDLLVHLSSVVETVLTGSSNREHDLGRMPSSDTGDLSETLVGLSGKLRGTPSSGNTLESVTLGDTDDIDDLVLLEDGLDVEGLLEVTLGKGDLVGDRASVNLDLDEVSLLLLEAGLSDLGVGEDSNDRAVFLDSLKLSGDGGTRVLLVLLGVLGEGLLLGSVPVLVESPLELVRKVLGPNGGERSETSGGLDVTDNTNDDHGRGLDNGDSLDNLSLVHLGSRSVEVSDDVSHTGLVTKSGGEVDRLLGVVLREGLHLSSSSDASLPGKETQGSVSGSFVLSVTERMGMASEG